MTTIRTQRGQPVVFTRPNDFIVPSGRWEAVAQNGVTRLMLGDTCAAVKVIYHMRRDGRQITRRTYAWRVCQRAPDSNGRPVWELVMEGESDSMQSAKLTAQAHIKRLLGIDSI